MSSTTWNTVFWWIDPGTFDPLRYTSTFQAVKLAVFGINTRSLVLLALAAQFIYFNQYDWISDAVYQGKDQAGFNNLLIPSKYVTFKPPLSLLSYGDNLCNRQLYDSKQNGMVFNTNFDFIIVGAGAAGKNNLFL
jgi:hypothetical protein